MTSFSMLLVTNRVILTPVCYRFEQRFPPDDKNAKGVLSLNVE